MAISTLPAAPSRTSPATFADKADALLGALAGFVTEANALETNVNAKEVSAVASAAAALVSQAAAAVSEANAAAVTAAPKWVSGTTYAIGNCTWSPTNYKTYRRITTGAGTTDPIYDATNWAIVLSVVESQATAENIVEDLSILPPVTFTWDPGSLDDGVGETSAAITVPGATLGSTQVMCIAPYDLQGITLNAWVSAANTCKARLQNESGGTLDLASGTWTMQARRI